MTESCQMSAPRPPCKCPELPEAAADPAVPLEHDEDLNEFRFVTRPPSVGFWSIYYCPFCGGEIPSRSRAQLYADVTPAELRRLEDLVKGIGSVDEAITRLGKPDRDDPAGFIMQGRESAAKPPRATARRVIRWLGHSEAAAIVLQPMGPFGVSFTFEQKYIGPKQAL